jgi:hypothetical protein
MLIISEVPSKNSRHNMPFQVSKKNLSMGLEESVYELLLV